MDKTQVRTAADLEKKYNFPQMLGLTKNIENTEKQLIKVQNELNNMLNSLVINLGDLLDSQSSISLWFYDGTPTTSNEPYTDWNDPTEHYGDFYYDRLTGYVYKFTENDWEQQDDTNLINAMALTNVELDVENDHERQVFFDTPIPPYQSGDWWILEDGTLMICQIGKPVGETYEEYDFINSSKYTETVATKINNQLTVLSGTVTMIQVGQAGFSSRVEAVEILTNDLNTNLPAQIDQLRSEDGNIRDADGNIVKSVASQIEQSAQSVTTTLTDQINGIKSYIRYTIEDVYNPISKTWEYDVGVVTIGMEGNPIKLKLSNDLFFFEDAYHNKVAYMGTNPLTEKSKLYIVDAQMLSSIQIGKFAFEPKSNDSLSFRKVG